MITECYGVLLKSIERKVNSSPCDFSPDLRIPISTAIVFLCFCFVLLGFFFVFLLFLLCVYGLSRALL